MPIEIKKIQLSSNRILQIRRETLNDASLEGASHLFHNRIIEMRPEIFKDASAQVCKKVFEPHQWSERVVWIYVIYIKITDDYLNINQELEEYSSGITQAEAKNKACSKIINLIQQLGINQDLVSNLRLLICSQRIYLFKFQLTIADLQPSILNRYF